MIRGIHHTGVSTRDLDRFVAFYSGLLNFEVVNEFSWDVGTDRFDAITDLEGSSARAAFLKLGNAFIEVFEYATPTPKTAEANRPVCDHGITHVALLVDDVQAEYDRLTEAGVHFHAPPSERMPAVYGRDPDGNVFELMQVARESRIALDV